MLLVCGQHFDHQVEQWFFNCRAAGIMGGDEELLDCWAPSLVSGSVALPGALTGSQVMLVLVVWGPLR